MVENVATARFFRNHRRIGELFRVNVLEIAYNEELNRCIVTFTIEGRNDIAIVNLENHIVGYRSLYLRITDPQELIDYAKDAFDPFVLLNYQKGEGWVVLDE